MADSKLTALTALGTPADADILYVVDDPAGTPVSKKVTPRSTAARIRPKAVLRSVAGP